MQGQKGGVLVGSAGKDTQELCVAHHASYAINLKTFLVRILSREPLESQQESDVLTGVGPDWQARTRTRCALPSRTSL